MLQTRDPKPCKIHPRVVDMPVVVSSSIIATRAKNNLCKSELAHTNRILVPYWHRSPGSATSSKLARSRVFVWKSFLLLSSSTAKHIKPLRLTAFLTKNTWLSLLIAKIWHLMQNATILTLSRYATRVLCKRNDNTWILILLWYSEGVNNEQNNSATKIV